MRQSFSHVRAVCGLLLLFAPGFASAAEPPAHRVKGDLAIRARDIFHRYCSECHTGIDAPGQSKLKVMEHAKVTAKRTPIPFVDPKGRSQLVDLVKDGSMPPANRPGPTADEVATLDKWVKADAPAYPVAFDERYVLNAIADDFEQESAKIKDGTAGVTARYVSFAHLIHDGNPLPDFGRAEVLLLQALSRATGYQITPEPVDPAATLFRISTVRFGSGPAGRFERWEGRKSAGAFGLQPFDLVLMEYPHATQLAADDPFRKRLDKLLARTSQLRPVPYVRGDWLSDALVDGKSLTALAEDLKSLAALGRAEAPDGPVAKPFAGAKPVVVPAATGGRTPIPSLSAWYAGDVTPEKLPFNLKAELVVDGKPVAGVTVDQTFSLRVSSDKKAFLMLLLVQADGEVIVQEVEGGTVLLPGQERLLGPKGGFSVTSILGGGANATEHLVLFACETELSVPTVLRSKHGDKYIWRFLMEPTEREKFDSNAVVRKVIPIKVTKK